MCWVLKELKDDIGLKELKRYCCPIVVDIAAIAIMIKTRTRVMRWPGSSSGLRVARGTKVFGERLPDLARLAQLLHQRLPWRTFLKLIVGLVAFTFYSALHKVHIFFSS